MENSAYRLEDQRDEMLNGRIVAMSPRPAMNHNRISGNIYHIFRTFLRGKTCEAFTDGMDLFLTPTDRFVPDGMIVCNKDFIKKDGIHGAPDLVVEVLSSGTAKNDRGYKKDAYQRAGVQEYWIVDLANKAIEIYSLADGVFVLNHMYHHYLDSEIEEMKEDEKADIVKEFCSPHFPEMKLSLEEIFERVDWSLV